MQPAGVDILACPREHCQQNTHAGVVPSASSSPPLLRAEAALLPSPAPASSEQRAARPWCLACVSSVGIEACIHLWLQALSIESLFHEAHSNVAASRWKIMVGGFRLHMYLAGLRSCAPAPPPAAAASPCSFCAAACACVIATVLIAACTSDARREMGRGGGGADKGGAGMGATTPRQ